MPPARPEIWAKGAVPPASCMGAASCELYVSLWCPVLTGAGTADQAGNLTPHESFPVSLLQGVT